MDKKTQTGSVIFGSFIYVAMITYLIIYAHEEFIVREIYNSKNANPNETVIVLVAL